MMFQKFMFDSESDSVTICIILFSEIRFITGVVYLSCAMLS